MQITNVSGENLSSLKLKFRGGTSLIATLKSNETARVRINPSGESGVGIEFLDSSGLLRTNYIDVYMEQNYRGTLYLTVNPGGKVTHKNNIIPF